MAGGAPGNMHPAQVAEAIRAMNGQMPSQEYRPGVDDAAPPPPGWAPPPLPADLQAEIMAGGGEIPADLAAPGPERQEIEPRPFSGRQLAAEAKPALRTWEGSVQLHLLRVLKHPEHGLVLELETGDGALRLNEEEADVVLDVLLKAVTRGMEERLKALRAEMFGPKRNPLDAEKSTE